MVGKYETIFALSDFWYGFIGWVLILYITTSHGFSIENLKLFFNQKYSFSLSGLLAALPIGVLIHQLFVLIKTAL